MPSPFAPNPRYPVHDAVGTKTDNNRYVEIAKLQAQDKQKLWVAIKKKRPALAELLGDSFVTALKDAFGATPMLTEQDYNSLMETENVS